MRVGLLDTLRRLLGGAQAAPPPITGRAGGYPVRQAPDRTERNMLALYAVNPELRTPVSAIARACANVDVYAAVDGERAPDSLLASILARPNSRVTQGDWLTLCSIWWDLTGDVFELVEYDEGAQRVQVYPIPPSWVTVHNGETLTYEVQWPGGNRVIYTDDQMLWHRSVNPADPYGRGTGAGLAAADEADIAEACSTHTMEFFASGARPGQLVHAPGASGENIERLRAEWLNRHQGRSHTTEFLGGSPESRLTVHQMSTDFKDLGIVELRQSVADIIRRLYGVPPELIGQIESSNRATIQAAYAILAELVIEPRIRAWVGDRNARLLPRLIEATPAGRQRRELERSSIAYVSPVPDDEESRRDHMQKVPWAYTVNEHRALAGLPPRDGGDVYVRDTSRQVVVDAGEIEDMTAQVRMLPPPIPGDAVVLRLLDGGAPITRAVSEDEIERILDALTPERIPDAMREPIQQTLITWATATAAEASFDLTGDLLNPFVAGYLRDFGLRLADETTNTTKAAIRAQLIEGVRAGEGISQLTARVRAATQFNANRAELIARTETLRAANAAKHHTYTLLRRAGVVEQIQWVSTLDRRTRPAHAALSGQIRTVGTPFEINGMTAPYPGGFAEPGQNCRCRCTIVGVFEEGGKTREGLAEAYKTFDEELAGDDARATAAAQTGLDQQRDEIIAALIAADQTRGVA